MNSKQDVLHHIETTGAILIIRLDDACQARAVAHAAISGGFRALEITLTMQNALDVIRELAATYAGERVSVGAGTVLNPAMAQECIDAGADFLVSPNLNPGLLHLANLHQVVTISGAFTPTEIVNTVEAGADIVKLFPAEFMGPAWAKSILAPLPDVLLMPAGGVTVDNVADWFSAGVHCVAAGSAVTKAGDVTAAAIDFLAAVAKAR
jgi:2-dehydro-3-deoxyphosphogluconate aldolase/(4S)-4-hydroxy-2-oxoglutarate aldolase